MAFELEPEPQQVSTPAQVAKVASSVLDEILSVSRYSLRAFPVPLAMSIGYSLIPIKDLSTSIERFRDQNAMLERANKDWPTVRLVFQERPQLGERWIPIDLRDGIHPRESKESVEYRLRSGDIQDYIITEARRANLQVKLTDRREATRNFIDVLSEFIATRASRSVHREDDDPPSEDFKITTDEANQEILFATGYFISTKQGFGISTPAMRKLQWGTYIFGINKRREIRFSDTPWTVPDVLSIHLTV
jgi:hypothetical protein